MDSLTQILLASYQRNFPLTSRPFEDMAQFLQSQGVALDERELIEHIVLLKEQGTITRVGPVFDHRKAGASTLAAVQAPSDKVEWVAEKINDYPEVNHNYGREDDFNLWFVVTAPNQQHLMSVIRDIESDISLPVLTLPMEQAYHIDLGFHIGTDSLTRRHGLSKDDRSDSLRLESAHNMSPSNSGLNHSLEVQAQSDARCLKHFKSDSQALSSDKQQSLRSLIQDGFPLVQEPFRALASELKTSEGRVLSTIEHWLETSLVKRVGLVANHHRVGYTSNAMIVWDIPDSEVDGIGEAFKQSGLVTLCYRRTRSLPAWPFNLYCMVHSRDRSHVFDAVKQLTEACGLQNINKKILFSTKQYKQTGGHYTRRAANDLSQHEAAQSPTNHYVAGDIERSNISVRRVV